MATQKKGITGSPQNGEERVWRILKVAGWSAAALILLAPLLGGHFTDDVNWTFSDFLFAAIILGGTGLAFELALRQSTNGSYRIGAVTALAASFLLIWSNAAVGFIGSGANPANVLYFAMLAIPISGCFVSGLRARGMSVAMTATAITQTLITWFAFAAGLVSEKESIAIIAINVVFILLWLGSAMLFRKAAENEQKYA